jgi:trimeric autotransporter adhesin
MLNSHRFRISTCARLLDVGIAASIILFTVAISRAAPPNAGGSGGPNSNNSGPNGAPPPPPAILIPPADPSAVDQAKSQVAASHAELTKAERAVSEVTKKYQDSFNARPDVIEATAKVTNAKSVYDAAAAPVLATLTSSADYQTARATADEARQRLDNVKADASATPSVRIQAAKEALADKDALTKMRMAALASDSKVSAAKAELMTATQALANLRQQYDDSLKQDADYVSAKSAFDDAKATATEADQKLAAAKSAYARAVAERNTALAEQRRLDAQQAGARR